MGDHPRDCVFWAVSAALRESHEVKCSTWATDREGLLAQAGARKTSRDVHKPMTLSLRSRKSKKSERFRSEEGQRRRDEKKARRGFGPLAQAGKGGPGRSSGWSEAAAWQPWAQAQGQQWSAASSWQDEPSWRRDWSSWEQQSSWQAREWRSSWSP